jgi:acetate kinase
MTGGVLTINGGSSSIKFALYEPGEPPRLRLSGKVDRVGLEDGLLTATGGGAEATTHQAIDASDRSRAVEGLIEWLERHVGFANVVAIGHRVVHGGTRYTEARLITPEMVGDLRNIGQLDPDHMPEEVALIEAFLRRFPDLPQVACFDTAFHRDLPRVARLLPVPRRLEAAGVRRYGFHGLSFAYLMEELTRTAGPGVAGGRVVLAHLGAGASLAAVREGRCVDTTMAFTPTAGLVMATRTGDIDPGVLLYLMRTEQMDARQIDDLVNRRSGLLGVSETSPDMRDLLVREAEDSRAVDAVALFCYQAMKYVGAFAAVLGGLDTLVFAGGIGENAPAVRSRICGSLGFLGLALDEARNAANAEVISDGMSRVGVRVIRTDEELMIARTVFRLIENQPA